MSDSKKPPSHTSSSGDLPRRFSSALTTSDLNKPDSKSPVLGSPISPLHPQPATTTTTTTSSSSSSGSVSGRLSSNPALKNNNHSGEISSRPGHSRSNSHSSIGSPTPPPLIYSGGGRSSAATSSPSPPPPSSASPSGNIFPSGRILKTGMAARQPTTRSDVMATGTRDYGHGSIMWGTAGSGASSLGSVRSSGGGDLGNGSVKGDPVKRGMASVDPEEVKSIGNDCYKRGDFEEALSLYGRAIALSPRTAAYRSNKATALTALGRVAEAVTECEKAVRLDPGYTRAHRRLGCLLVRLGCVEFARKHLCHPGPPPEVSEMQKLQAVERCLARCTEARKKGDWKSTLREAEAAIAAGADRSTQIHICRAESLLKLQRLSAAIPILSNTPQADPSSQCYSQSKFFGMPSEVYLFYVRAQVEMSRGRFDESITIADKAGKMDPYNVEVATLVSNVKKVAKARNQGNDMFRSDRFTEACVAYGEGLRVDPTNSVLYCNRAACWFKLGMWDRSLEDCNHALRIQPNYTKALLRRAATNNKLEKWAEAVSDYEALKRELPSDTEVAESLFHAQVALKKSRGEDVSNMKFGGEVEEIFNFEHFRAAISFPGVSVVHFRTAGNPECNNMSAVLDGLCSRYPLINFLKVDIDGSPEVAEVENVKVVPTLKIYKNGSKVKEIINPTSEVLEASVRHYRL